MKRSENIPIYLEIGKKRIVAGALEWPGWCRIGRDEVGAIQALLEYGPRYGRVLAAAGIAFEAPADTDAFDVVERLEGSASTDFGVADAVPSRDAAPFGEDDLRHYEALLPAYWEAFDRAVEAATGKELRKGPRGGGRELEKIMEHVLGAQASYLRMLAWKHKVDSDAEPGEELKRIRPAILEALAVAARGELPEAGPRGGTIWLPRYFIRRSVWHLLDHAWEIEDRIVD